MQKNQFSRIVFIVLLICNVCMAGYFLGQKQGWHIDEQYSYGHANSTSGAFLSDDIDSYFEENETDLHHHWLDGKIFHDYLTVQNDERFIYGHIWENLQKSVHPPLFYVLLHTVCSFAPDVFSPWQAGSINLAAFLLTLIVLYLLSRRFIDNEYLAMVPVFFWGFSSIGMATVLFLRMYMLQTLFAVCLIYEIVKMIQENRADKRRLFLVFLYSSLGILTQYSSLIFSFIVAVVCCVVLLVRNNWKLLFWFALIMGLSAVVLCVVFPQAVEVLFFSQRGTEATKTADGMFKAFSDIKGLWMALLYSHSHSHVFSIYFNELFGIAKVWDIVLFWIVIFTGAILCRAKIKLNVAFVPLLLIVMLMTIYLSFFMPGMGVYQSRYYMLLMPMVAIILIYYATVIFKVFKMPSVVILAFMILGIIWQSMHMNWKQNPYSVQITPQTRQIASDVKGKKVVVSAPVYSLFDLAQVLKDADKVYWVAKGDDAVPVLANADYVFVANVCAATFVPKFGRENCFYCVPDERTFLEDNVAKKLHLIEVFRSGVHHFDVYEPVRAGI